jgi:hypothetical protein
VHHQTFKRRSDIQPVFDLLIALVSKYSLTLVAKHVKAHTKNKDKRSLANNFCDKRAKEEMERLRHERTIEPQLNVDSAA